MKWTKVVTRPFHLLQAYYAQLAYHDLSGFSIKNALIISRDGVIEKYLYEGELKKFYRFIKGYKGLKNDLKNALELDRELAEIIKKDPVKIFPDFHKKYVKYWSYNVLAYYAGHVLSEDDIKPLKKEIEFLRGKDCVMERIENQFFPKLCKKLERMTGISSSLLAFSHPDEIMKKRFDPEILKLRKKYYVWLIKKGKSMVYVGRKAHEIEEKELEKNEEDFSKLNEIKGTSASPGHVKGKVKIVLKPEEITKVRKGDIIIAVMTNPGYVPAMKKAAGIVTDEGGITCHAAILAREIRKPCITGTKISTKTFKDGDLVEVNADKGIVKRIKRAGISKQ